MKFNINKELLPIKAHFFFFFAALGPLLSQMNVFGRQLGVSPGAMGLVTAVLPLLWAAAKPLFGYIVDFWPAQRKLVFMLLITIMSGTYCLLWVLPMPDEADIDLPLIENVYRLNDTINLRQIDNETQVEKYACHWNCTSSEEKFVVYLSNSSLINTMYLNSAVNESSCSTLHMEIDSNRFGNVTCLSRDECNLLCFEQEDQIQRTKRDIKSSDTNISNHVIIDLSKPSVNENDVRSKISKFEPKSAVTVVTKADNFYMTVTFWAFVVLMCTGTVAFNVANCIGDAVCFDVLGLDRSSKYGAQRAWGTAGYGATALLGGWLMDLVSTGTVKDFTPAFIITLAFTAVDLFCCRALNLPSLSSPEDSGKALRDVLRMPKVIVFIIFAVVAGTFDSFIIYYMFWFLEELAEVTGDTGQIKLIEGMVIAAQAFIGEILFFYFSGKIINRWGYGRTFTFALLCYGVRMALISVIQRPWHLIIIEGVMQGPTYALCYSAIVGYAARVAPEGYSATVQGVVAGMDDGVGFAVGSLVGGLLYSYVGGRTSFRILAACAVVSAVAHRLLTSLFDKEEGGAQKQVEPPTKDEDEKMLPDQHSYAIYRNTTEPLKADDR